MRVWQEQVAELEFGYVVDAVFAVILLAFPGVDGGNPDGFNPFADGEDEQWRVGEVQLLFNGIFVKGSDDQPAQPHFGGFEQHALRGDAQVNVHHFGFGFGGAHDDECLGLCAGEGKVQFGKCASHFDMPQHGVGPVFASDKPETEALLVACGGDFGIHFGDFLQHFAGDDMCGIVTAAAPISLQKRVNGDTFHNGFVAFIADELVHSVF